MAFERGYQLWASDVNAHGGLLGRQVKLVILNDHSSQNTVVTNYQELIGKDKVDLTFGPYSSLLTTPASAVAARYGYAFVEGAGGAPAVFDTPLNQANHDVFDVSPAGRGLPAAVRELHRPRCRRPAAEDRGLPLYPGSVRRAPGAAGRDGTEQRPGSPKVNSLVFLEDDQGQRGPG